MDFPPHVYFFPSYVCVCVFPFGSFINQFISGHFDGKSNCVPNLMKRSNYFIFCIVNDEEM